MLRPVFAFFAELAGRAVDTPARRLYAVAAAQARQPDFFLRLGVPDTVDGRFELVVLHVFLLLRRLKDQGADAHRLGQRLLEAMVDDFDAAVRELGVGDTGVARRVKTMARGFAGRLSAYHRGVEAGDDEALDVALDNNLYGTVTDVAPVLRAAMITYIRRELAGLAAQPLEEILAGRAAFGLATAKLEE